MSVFNGHRFWVRLLPQILCDGERLNVEALPPGQFIARLMQLPVMTAAERDSELIADLHAERSRLGKPQMMRI